MPQFYIPDLVPLEDEVRDYSLRFLTQIWRNFGSFSPLNVRKNDSTNVPPYVYTFGGVHYLDDGNHRSVWKLLNGIFTIMAEEEFPDSDRQKSTLRTVESARERGISSFFDLARKVRNPKQYSPQGPVTHVITAEDLRNPDYYLRI